jgi:ubiquinone/menaquinone biosynthesis C-methylase UbiE
MSHDLPFTGERFVPGDPAAVGEMWAEHWHRYHFAMPLARGLRVLDVACGEGYGSALLAGAAASVTGVDVAAAAIAHARRRYAEAPGLQFVEAPCERLPFADAAFDLVVSFETLEHIDAHDAFFAEVRRVLTPDGLFMVSTPDKAEYSDKRGIHNEFHVKELYAEEFERLLARHFARCRILHQRNAFVSLIHEGEGATAGELLTVDAAHPDRLAGPLPPLYRIALATNGEGSGWRLPARLSVFCDAAEWISRDYRATYQACQHLQKREKELEAELALLRQQLATAPPAAPESALARLIKRLST